MTKLQGWALAIGWFTALGLGCATEEEPPPKVAGENLMTRAAHAWSPDDFAQMEEDLGVAVPPSYQEFILHHAAELAELTYPLTYVNEPDANVDSHAFKDYHLLYLDPAFITRFNLDYRNPQCDLGRTFPEWWKTYFLFGHNGGSGIYGLRLDGDLTVWQLELDGGRVDRAYESIDALRADSLECYRHNLPLYQAEREWFEQVQNGEMTKELFQQKVAELDYRF